MISQYVLVNWWRRTPVSCVTHHAPELCVSLTCQVSQSGICTLTFTAESQLHQSTQHKRSIQDLHQEQKKKKTLWDFDISWLPSRFHNLKNNRVKLRWKRGGFALWFWRGVWGGTGITEPHPVSLSVMQRGGWDVFISITNSRGNHRHVVFPFVADLATASLRNVDAHAACGYLF